MVGLQPLLRDPLLLMVGLQPLLRDPLLLLAFLLIGASKEVDVIVFLLSRSRLGRSRLGRSWLGGWLPTLELANARLQGEDQGLQVVRDFLELLVLHLEGVEFLDKSHVFAAAGS